MITAERRRRLEAQGFVGLDEATLESVAPWLRWSTSLCALLMGMGTALASPWILWATGVTALLGAIFPMHPFDLLYNIAIRPLTKTPKLPWNRAPRRFACGMATAWLAGTGYAFYSGARSAGYVLGGILTLVALIVSTTDFCIPSLVYGLIFRHPGCPADD
jgi:hypothetical protein